MPMRIRWTAALLAAFLLLPALAAADTWYVYTENGKTLNLRSEVNNSVIANIPYGTALEPDPDKSSETAAYVTYKDKSGYVKWKFLVQDKPAPKVRTSTPTPAPVQALQPVYGVPQQAAAPASVASVAVSALYSGFRQREGSVVVRTADRLFWSPDNTQAPITTITAGTELEALTEDNYWIQVYDPQKRLCGFMLKSSLSEKAP